MEKKIYKRKDNVVRDKSFGFALRVVKLYKYLSEEKREYVLSKQLLRSGTSIGANVREAEQAESQSDFIHKMAIALKETNESIYWLELLHQGGFIENKAFESLYEDVTEILKLLTSIVKSSKMKIVR